MPIWVAARATSAAPVFFEHYQNYADGGIKANNPSSSGLARIHKYYNETGRTNYKISTVVSLGCGDYTIPASYTDVHKCMSSWKPLSIIKNAKDLVTTMGNLFKVLQKEVRNKYSSACIKLCIFVCAYINHLYFLSLTWDI